MTLALCTVSEYATALVTILAAIVLVIRELRREPSAGIPPTTKEYADGRPHNPLLDG